MDSVIINCDWLQYSVILEDENPEFICPDGYRIEVLQGNNIFRYRALIFDEQGRKWLTLLWSPFSSLLNKRLMTVQVANQLLYYNAINLSFNLLQQCVDCHFNSCGRVDVCADFQIDDEKLETLRHLNSGHYYVQGKGEGSVWWHSTNESNGEARYQRNQLHCLSWGSKNSDIKVKCYNKSREQGMLAANPEPEKPYIVQLWREAGWDEKSVWRLEFSLSGTGKLRWKNAEIKLQEVSSTAWLTDVFYSLYGSRFVVRENQGKRCGHKNLDALRPLLDLPEVDDIITRSLGTMDNAQASDAVKLLRKLMSQLESPVVTSNVDVCEGLVSAIWKVVEANRLNSYFLNHFGSSADEYLQNVMDNAGTGIYEVDGKPSRTWC